MISRLKIAALLAACLTGIFGCGPEPLAGGTIETTNGITARVVLPNGAPASNIKVFLLDEQDWLAKTKAGESIVLDSAETDTSGKFEFEDVDTNRTSSLYADVETYGVLIHDVSQQLVDDQYQGKIGLSKKVSYEGVVKETTFVAEKIFLAGSPFAAEVDANGKFIIKDVPQELYSVVILRKLPNESLEYVVSDKVKLDEWNEGKPVTIVPDTAKALLVEDFEDLDNRNLLGPIFGGGWWDAADDYPTGNSVLLQPANAAPQNFSKAIKDGGGERIHCLQVLYTPGTRPGPYEAVPFVVLTTNLGSQGVHYNLSGMDSLTLFTGGNGQLEVELVQENPANSGVALSLLASATFDLDSTWRKISIKPSDLVVTADWFPEDLAAAKAGLEGAKLPAYTKKPETFAEMGGMITQIRFKGKGGKEFWLDHIRIHGITAGDLVK
jgi:hypothetical protein